MVFWVGGGILVVVAMVMVVMVMVVSPGRDLLVWYISTISTTLSWAALSSAGSWGGTCLKAGFALSQLAVLPIQI